MICNHINALRKSKSASAKQGESTQPGAITVGHTSSLRAMRLGQSLAVYIPFTSIHVARQ